MKKKSNFIVVLICIFIVLMSKKVNSATSATVFVGESLSIEKIESVEITSNEITIDTNTSKVTNSFLIKNMKNEEFITKITAKLEDEKSNFTIKDLSITVNNLEIKNIQKVQDNYIFFVCIKPQEYEKIVISYITENDLKNAKVIKYTLDSLKGQKIKKFSLDVVIPEEDVPLVKKIYPECFEFNEENSDIKVQYYNFEVNNLTKDFIIEKETYKNLIYGDNEKDEFDEAVYRKAKDMMLNGIDNNYSKHIMGEGERIWFERQSFFSSIMDSKMPYESYKKGEEKKLPEQLESILEYILYKQLKRDGETTVKGVYIFNYTGDYPLIKDLFYKYNFSDLDGNLYGKKVCVDYVESEGDKELYLKSNKDDLNVEYIKKSELDILKSRPECGGEGETLKEYKKRMKNSCYRVINFGLNINNEQIDATDKEKAEYVNMINTDLYIRKVIYDGKVTTSDRTIYDIPGGIKNPKISSLVAYYTDDNRENAINYIRNILYNPGGKGYVDESIKKFENEEIAQYAKVPTITDCVGFRTSENGKYFVTYFMGFEANGTSLGYVENVLEADSAKSIINQNDEANEKIKQEVESEIANAKIIDDEIEFEIKREESLSSEIPAGESIEKVDNKFNLSKNEMIFIGIIGCAILINIIIIIRNKRRNKNGK